MVETDDYSWLDAVRWGPDGLVPAIAQERDSGEVLTLAWMNREALRLTASEGQAVYWSRTRKRLWRKGESSGHVQQVHEIRLDCDNDTVLLSVSQLGLACHTGRRRCFFMRLERAGWTPTDPVLKDPAEIYGKKRAPK
jgi:phosphoribosyl-AMP cyclohydrolase